MKEEIKYNQIKEFDSKIKKYEDVLFGMGLFMQGIAFTWIPYSPKIVGSNLEHYENAKKRMEEAISEAKKLLEETEQYPDKISLLQQFQFPLIKGRPMLDEGTKRFEMLVQAYNKLFPDRPRNKPLTKEENRQLIEMAIKIYERKN